MKITVCELMDLFQINPLIVVIKDNVTMIYKGEYQPNEKFCYKFVDSMFVDNDKDSETEGYLYIYLE